YLLNHHYLNYGILKLDQKEYEEAKKLIHKSLDLTITHLGKTNPETSRCYEYVGVLCRLRGNYTQALQYYQRALISLSDHFNDTTIQANPEPENVLSKSQLVNILKRKAKTLANLKQNRKQNLKTALINYELALKTIGELRTDYQSQGSKLNLTANERETFINTIETAIELYNRTSERQYLNKAFRYAEESKAAVLYEAMQFNQALNMGNIPDSLEKKEDQLKKDIWTYEELIFEERKKREPNESRLNLWDERLFELNREYEALIDKFEEEYPKYHSLKYEQSPMKVSNIQKKVKSGETLIEYVLTESNIYAFLIEKDDFQLKTIPVDTTFTNNVLELRNFLSARNFSNHSTKDFQKYNTLAYHLYSKLIQPLNLDSNQKLTIIPDELLSYLPFEVLVTENTTFDEIRYNDLAYLIKKYDMGYSYSAKVLYSNNSGERRSRRKLAAFAPTYANIDDITEYKARTRQEYREKLYPLKGIKEEAQRITRIIKGDTYMDGRATEEAFKDQSENYDILHLAMHTLVNDEDPMYSKMAFTQEKESKEDGFLNTYEIYNLELNSRLVVLSSCNTGTGKLQKGEGVISLARGFKYAGCPSIVMTMWPVEDNSSIRLMEYFYEVLADGEHKDHALRKAKIKFLENSDPLHAHPYFWSGYILIGDKTPLYNFSRIWWMGGGTAFLIIVAVLFFTGKRYLRQVF
ncbi:MAG: CHAT domain-containing protein, partial [Bacteroidales bacterium]